LTPFAVHLINETGQNCQMTLK